jgi:hypothetical protein
MRNRLRHYGKVITDQQEKDRHVQYCVIERARHARLIKEEKVGVVVPRMWVMLS